MRYIQVKNDVVRNVHIVNAATDQDDPSLGVQFLEKLWGGSFQQNDTAQEGWLWNGSEFVDPNPLSD